jgi:predicted AAA+ superfamily ATPase
MIYPTSLSFNQLLDFLSELAKSEGQPIKHSLIARKVGISEATQKKLLYAFESVYLIRRLEILGGRRGFVVYLEDQAECAYLQGRFRDDHLRFEAFLYRNLRAQFRYAIGLKTREFQYLSRGKARIPFAFECEFGALGIIALEGNTPTRSNLSMAASFLKSYDKAKIIFVSRGKKSQFLNPRMAVVPASCLV